jgi:excisionase family DNA binding protein
MAPSLYYQSVSKSSDIGMAVNTSGELKGKLMKESESARILENKVGASNALSISVRSLERLIAKKELKVVRLSRRVMISRRSLEEWARKNAQ